MNAALTLALCLAPAAPAPKPNPDEWVLRVTAPDPKLRAEYTRVVTRLFREYPMFGYTCLALGRGGRVVSLKGVYDPARAILGKVRVHSDVEKGFVRVDLRAFPAAERPALKSALQWGWDEHLRALRESLDTAARLSGPPRATTAEYAFTVRAMEATRR